MRTTGHKASRAILHEPYEIGVTHEWFVMPMRKKPWPKGTAQPWQSCAVCNGKWRPWAGSLLPCHAKCLWTPDGAVALFNDPRNVKQLMADLGVTVSVIRAGKHVGEKFMAVVAEKVATIHERSKTGGGLLHGAPGSCIGCGAAVTGFSVACGQSGCPATPIGDSK